ncbi:hypothetical protein GALLR39Z86_44450 [Glycomyces algeriensis]|uniref:Uncharacterized protein n=1 Tax=Glycomyces algeriensis TaxID=256037 RepID=A0A9W6LIN9_9ACTN|nr:hypothetical protein GALLR39Z86_44450 [Glycomyces algeriensis]
MTRTSVASVSWALAPALMSGRADAVITAARPTAPAAASGRLRLGRGDDIVVSFKGGAIE